MNEHSRQPGRIGVFLVDDHEIFRRGIRARLAGEADIEVAGEGLTKLGMRRRTQAAAFAVRHADDQGRVSVD
jgi:two-component system response regulator DevR